jgi:hypothetical protein
MATNDREYSASERRLPAFNLVHERLAALFDGCDRAHTRRLKIAAKANEAGKVEADYTTVKRAPTKTDWQAHLNGDVGLVIVPLRSDGTVLFATIDIDDYWLDHRVIVEAVDKLPFIVCRTKSGGLHVFVFFTEPVPAVVARRKLREVAVGLGYPKAEVFPKQSEITDTVPVGSAINVPYFAGNRSLQYAYGPDGAFTVAEFLDLAEASRIGVNEFETLPIPFLPRPKATANLIVDDDFAEAAGFENVDDTHLWHEAEFTDGELAAGGGSGDRHNKVKCLAGKLFATHEAPLAEVLVRLYARHQCDPPFGVRGKEVRELIDIIRWFVARERA